MANPQAEIVINAVDKTKAAFAAVKKSLTDIETKAVATNSIVARFIPLLGAATVTSFASNIIDAADGMNDLSRRTGVSVDRIAAWDLATRQSGTSVDALASALDKGSKYIVEHGDELKKLGINAKTSEELIFQLSDVISSLPADDPRRAAIAMQVLGRSAGELLPLLSEGSDALRQMVEEGGKNAAVMAELAPLADSFNDRLEVMKLRAQVTAATGLTPLLATLEKFIELREKLNDKVETANDSLTLTGAGAGLNPLLSILGIYAAISGEAENVAASNSKAAQATGDHEKQVHDLQVQLALLNGTLEEQQQNLAKSSKALQSDAYKKNLDSLKEQVKGFQDLGKSMQTAFIDAGNAAKEALQKAKQLQQSADSIRQSGQDRVRKLDAQNLSPQESDRETNIALDEALNKADSARKQADFQRLQGNVEEAQRLLDISQQQGERASELSDQLNDEGLKRQQILASTEALARVEESRKQVAQKNAEEESARQESLRTQMQDNEQRIADHMERVTQLAAKIQDLANNETAIKIKLDEEALQKTRQQIDELQNRLANLNFRNFTGAYDSSGNAIYREDAPGFAGGGHIRGPGTATSDSILARLSNGEYVLRAAAVRKYGLDYISRINSMQLPQFANGGLASRITIPNIPSAPPTGTGLHRGTFVLAGGERVEVQAMPSEFDKLARAALMHGGLK
jgi:hypothetical protein